MMSKGFDLQRDLFLETYFGSQALNLKLAPSFQWSDLNTLSFHLDDYKKWFLTWKVNAAGMLHAKQVAKILKLNHICTGIQLCLINLDDARENHESDLKVTLNPNLSVADLDDLENIARTAFEYSRFHQDPQIPNDIANDIKRGWVRNAALGIRGDGILVAYKSDRPVGFLSFAKSPSSFVIDLIATDRSSARKGVASSLLNKLCSITPKPRSISVWTQEGNLSAINFYEKNGFFKINANQIFHAVSPGLF